MSAAADTRYYNRRYRQQKRALTLAVNTGNWTKVEMACKDAVRTWNEIGGWPDNWSRWQRALDDACLRAGVTPRTLEELGERP